MNVYLSGCFRRDLRRALLRAMKERRFRWIWEKEEKETGKYREGKIGINAKFIEAIKIVIVEAFYQVNQLLD